MVCLLRIRNVRCWRKEGFVSGASAVCCAGTPESWCLWQARQRCLCLPDVDCRYHPQLFLKASCYWRKAKQVEKEEKVSARLAPCMTYLTAEASGARAFDLRALSAPLPGSSSDALRQAQSFLLMSPLRRFAFAVETTSLEQCA